MRVLRPAIIASVVATCSIAVGRLSSYLPYDELTRRSDLVVIATPLAVRDTGQKTTIPGIRQGNNPVPAVGMETTFEVLAVLKGDSAGQRIVLYHLREETRPQVSKNGPALASFEPKQKKRYLLFLKHDKDDRYLPSAGQLDPADTMKDLGTYP